VASLLKKYSGFGAVFAANDEMIVGAIDAMSAAHVDLSKMVTVGCDASPVAFQYMKDGKLSATIDPFPAKQAGQALQYLVDYIKNKTKPPKQVVLIEPKLVTPELVTIAP
jgi:ABC-type sugar transport system substrate-binding protein